MSSISKYWLMQAVCVKGCSMDHINLVQNEYYKVTQP